MQLGAPHVVSWNLTRRCNLACDHCYLDAAARAGADELSTERCLAIVDELAAANPGMMLILTGGEPLLRPDLPHIARAASAAGLTVVVGTNGTVLDDDRARALRDAGVQGVGVSVDSLAGGQHDRLRGRPGALTAAARGIEAARRAGLELLIQTTLFPWNRAELGAIAAAAEAWGARAWNVYFLVCTGRGQQLVDLPPADYERALREVAGLQGAWADRLAIGVRCAPHYRRIAAELPGAAAAVNAYPSGCPAGIHYARIGPRGEVTACPYMPEVAGELGRDSFAAVWQGAPALARLRDRAALGGRCGPCSYRDTCGGCRARALAVHGDALAEDPSCAWDPAVAGDAVPPPTFALPDARTMPWTAEAIARLGRVPSFVRGLVVKRVEAEARARAAPEVTAEIMKAVRARQVDREHRAATRRSGAAGVVWLPAALARLLALPASVRAAARARAVERARDRGASAIEPSLLDD